MARLEGLIKEVWPTCTSYLTWIENTGPRRHLVVRFGKRVSRRVSFAGAGATWRDAFEAVERARRG